MDNDFILRAEKIQNVRTGFYKLVSDNGLGLAESTAVSVSILNQNLRDIITWNGINDQNAESIYRLLDVLKNNIEKFVSENKK